MNEDDAIGKAELIPNFFYEIIGRIIPGLVVITLYLYWSQSDFKAVFSNATISILALVAAWIIGVTLDVGVFMTIREIGLRIYREGMENFLKGSKTSMINELDEWDYLCRANPWERGLIIKNFAQVVFFRGMTSICALIVFVCIIAFTEVPSSLGRWLPALVCHDVASFLFGSAFLLVFGLCWYRSREGTFRHVQALLGRIKSLEAKAAAPASCD